MVSILGPFALRFSPAHRFRPDSYVTVPGSALLRDPITGRCLPKAREIGIIAQQKCEWIYLFTGPPPPPPPPLFFFFFFFSSSSWCSLSALQTYIYIYNFSCFRRVDSAAGQARAKVGSWVTTELDHGEVHG